MHQNYLGLNYLGLTWERPVQLGREVSTGHLDWSVRQVRVQCILVTIRNQRGAQ